MQDIPLFPLEESCSNVYSIGAGGTNAVPDLLYMLLFSESKVGYLLFYIIHLNTCLLSSHGHLFSVEQIVFGGRYFAHPDSPLLSPLLLSECFKVQVSTDPWGPVIESSDGRTECHNLIKNATENTYIIPILHSYAMALSTKI